MNDYPPEPTDSIPQFSLFTMLGFVTTICVLVGICVAMGLEVVASLVGLVVIVGVAATTIAIIEAASLGKRSKK